MKLPRPYSAGEIADMVGGAVAGNPDALVFGVNEIHVVETGDLVFVDHPKYYAKTLDSSASVVLIDKAVPCPDGKTLIVLPDPFSAFNKVTREFRPVKPSGQMLSPSARIGKGTVVQPGVFIGNDVTIGKDCFIHPGVVIYDGCTIGNQVIIHANTVIGSDGFYYKKRPEGFDKLHSAGTVTIHNKVEIGAGCTIDKGVSGATEIGEGTKLDNHVHIGHDTRIGRHCLFAAQVGVAGCVTIEDHVTLWGQVGCASNVTIGKGAVVQAQSGVSKSLEGGKTYFGSPAGPVLQKLKQLAALEEISRNSGNSKKD